MLDLNKCTGCTACAEICGVRAVTMQENSEGFLQPVINKDICINCGRCEKVCPVNKKIASRKEVYVSRSLDKDVVAVSSSGGIFTEIAKYVFELGGVVSGCALSDKKVAEHIIITEYNDLERLRRSKYIQSTKYDVFKKLKSFLDTGLSALFVGSPCEVAGLKSFLGKDYPNLITVDFICHGVPSPKVWQKYVKDTEKNFNKRITDVNFRSKIIGWKNFSVELVFDDESKTSDVLTKNDYMRGFLENLYLRKSCYSCQFKNGNYHSDITVGDFFAVGRVMPEINKDEGTSLVIANTDKGFEIIDKISVNLMLLNQDSDILKYNDAYFSSPGNNFWRDKAIKEIFNKDFHTVIEKYCGNGFASKLRRKISKIMVKDQ